MKLIANSSEMTDYTILIDSTALRFTQTGVHLNMNNAVTRSVTTTQ